MKQLKFRVEARQHIAIVGRTGAGKTSIRLALLRAVEATGGSIEVDGITIKDINLDTLRQAICLVPQDPYLFAGSLQENLDPFDELSTEQIRIALKTVGFASDKDIPVGEEKDTSKTGTNLDGSHSSTDLQNTIEEGGTNLSLGQRQLVCLARALLRSPKIVILDEATASVGHATDSRIKDVVSMLPATVITIAHRLTSVLDHDKVLVLEQREVAEFDHPWKLMQKNGLFRALCQDHGNMEELERIAETAWRKSNNRSVSSGRA